MSFYSRIKSLNIGRQNQLIKNVYPGFDSTITSPKSLMGIGSLRPTSRSAEYKFSLDYKIGFRPKVKILEPKLIESSSGEKIPHIYSKSEPCLYYKNDFNSSMPIATTIIPWLSLWLYFYEDWHITGKWNGGGITHPTNNK